MIGTILLILLILALAGCFHFRSGPWPSGGVANSKGRVSWFLASQSQRHSTTQRRRPASPADATSIKFEGR